MKVSDAIAKMLYSKNIRVVFGYQGGAITHMIDSFDKCGISYVQNYNEQGSGFAADAFSRISSDGVGCAIGTNGPGATNLITAIANAYCDSIPVLFISGQVHTFAMKNSDSIRQESFQEIDIVSIVKPITKYAKTILNKNDALREVSKAIKISLAGRPGPVLIDIPVDVQGEDIDFLISNDDTTQSDTHSFCELSGVLNGLYNAQKPVIISGGGIRIAGAADLLRSFVKKSRIPVVTSLMGLDSIPHNNENFCGFIGSYGNRYANLAVQNADYILALGTRLDSRQIGKRKDLFAPHAKILHVDIDKSEINHSVKSEQGLNVDLKDFLSRIDKEIDYSKLQTESINKWTNQINQWKEHFANVEEIEYVGLNPNKVFEYLGSIIPNNSIICSDVGQNQMWLAQSLRIAQDNIRILNSGGLGAMGYSLPAAIGAHYSMPESSVYAFMGDGGLQMNIQELQLVGSEHLPITIVVLNNHSLGLIRDVHEKYYERRYVGSVWGFSCPDLKYVCKAYGIYYIKVDDYKSLHELKDDHSIPRMIEVVFNEDTYVKPELLGNDPLDRQIPYREYDN